MAINLNAGSKPTCVLIFKTKFYEEQVSKLNQKTELLVPSAWINPCYGINLIIIATLAIFKTMCRRNINIIEQSELGIRQRSMLIVFDHCLQESEPGGQTLWKNYWHTPRLICLFTSFFASSKLRFQQHQNVEASVYLTSYQTILGQCNIGCRYLFRQAKYYPIRES